MKPLIASQRQVRRTAWRPELVEFSDLRRRQQEHAVDWILLRAQWLPKADRELIESVYREGKSAAEIARLSSGHEMNTQAGSRSANAVRTRIKQVVNRICSDKLPFVVERSPSWSPTRQRVAQHCVVQGHSMRLTSQRLGLSLHAVRRHMAAIDELYHASLPDRQAHTQSRTRLGNPRAKTSSHARGL